MWCRLLTCGRLSTGLLVFTTLIQAAVDRVVIVKVDGLPPAVLQQSHLPNLTRIFEQNGTILDNFYVRGLSLSAPSWSMLDTGRHLEIRGNVEYDRYTLRPYDYLNFVPFYLGYAAGRRADMPGPRLLDELGVPLLIDRFRFEQRYQSFQLFQRGVRWTTIRSSLTRMVTDRSPKDLFDEWETGGLSFSAPLDRQKEHELTEALKNPAVRYLDFFSGEYDHVAHLAGDRDSQLHAAQGIDALVGRLWAAIAQSPYPATTALVLVSDHGMNTVEGVYSQGFNLVDWFSSAAGGAHHVLTNRYPMTEFKLKGLDPFVHEVITPSADSFYLAGQKALYPTVMLDLDGNERASISLRNNTLNKLHVLLDQLLGRRLTGPVRKAALDAFFAIRGTVEQEWTRDVDQLSADLAAQDGPMEELQAQLAARPKHKWTRAEEDLGLDDEAARPVSRLETWKTERRGYIDYIATVRHLLALQPSDFDPGKFKIETVIPAKSLGPPNTIADLAGYVVGPAAGGLVLSADSSLDLDRSFRKVDYFPALESLSVRNNVQAGVSARPVDFTAVRLPGEDSIWLRRNASHQALIQTLRTGAGVLELRYVPISGLSAGADGALHFEPAAWVPGLPLELFEDPQLAIEPERRVEWLSQWHSEREWFEAVHRTRYSNGIVGLAEELLDLGDPATPQDSYIARKRRLRRTDLLVFANDHWNFNVRGFNPGGNHGSFLRISTHSVLEIAGGKDTGIPQGTHIATPYDSLSFVPTILTLLGKPEPDLPGPVIRELVLP